MASLVVTGLFLPSALTSEARITSTPESELGYRAMSEAMPPSPDVEESFVNELVVVRAPGGDIADAAALPSPSRQT